MVVRAIYNICYGLARNKGLFGLSPFSSTPTSIEGFTAPHIWKSKVRWLDCDLNLHMNNSSYLYCCELSRWEWCGSTGLLGLAKERGLQFLVAGQSIRYRRSLQPGQEYEIESQVVSADKRFLFVEHIFRSPSNYKGTHRVFASVTMRATILDRNGAVDPLELIQQLGFKPEHSPLEGPFQCPKLHPASAAFVEWDNEIKHHEKNVQGKK